MAVNVFAMPAGATVLGTPAALSRACTWQATAVSTYSTTDRSAVRQEIRMLPAIGFFTETSEIRFERTPLTGHALLNALSPRAP